MARREINIFSVSFLDLLSGALAAVIVLFVIVPKMDSQSREARDTLAELQLEASQLVEMVEQLESSVDEELYQQVVERLESVQEALEQQVARVARLESETERRRAENETLRSNVNSLSQRVSALRRQSAEQERALAESQAREGSQTLGVEAELAIVFQWTADADIDLYLQNVATGEWCYYSQANTPFARLLKDMQGATGSGYEMIYQERIVPGTYKLYINMYKFNEPAARTAEVSGYIVQYPYSDRSNRIELESRTLTYAGPSARTPGNGTFLRMITVTRDEIN